VALGGGPSQRSPLWHLSGGLVGPSLFRPRNGGPKHGCIPSQTGPYDSRAINRPRENWPRPSVGPSSIALIGFLPWWIGGPSQLTILASLQLERPSGRLPGRRGGVSSRARRKKEHKQKAPAAVSPAEGPLQCQPYGLALGRLSKLLAAPVGPNHYRLSLALGRPPEGSSRVYSLQWWARAFTGGRKNT